MQIVKNLKENTSHKLTGAGAYEWWHFDCIDEDNEYSFVTKFLIGNPFSSKYTTDVKEHLNFPELKKPEMIDYTALSFYLYNKNRLIYSINYDYDRNFFKVESNSGEDKIILEKNFFNFVKLENKYYLNINLSTTDLEKKFKAEFVFTVKSENSEQDSPFIQDQDEKHFWLPAAPVCEVSGKFKFYINFKRLKTEFNGFGYYDHHWGDEPLFVNIQNTYWGRVISDDYSLFYFYLDYFDKDKQPFKKLTIYKDGKIIRDLDEFNFETKSKMSFSALTFNKDIIISAEGVKMVCKNKTKLEEEYSISRYLSEFTLSLDDENVLKNNIGISEIISPKKFSIEV